MPTISEGWLVNSVGRAIGSHAKSLDIAIDVGANVGEWTAALAESFKRVIAMEPHDESRMIIARAEGVEVLGIAAAATTGEATLYCRSGTGQHSLTSGHPLGDDNTLLATRLIRTASLDDISTSGADFVKIDVEGAEVSVLRGCRKQGSWDRTVFVVECHATTVDVVLELWRLGKSVHHIPHPLPSAHPEHCWLIGVPAG